jgi:hypothetical protein
LQQSNMALNNTSRILNKIINDRQFYTISLVNYIILCGSISILGSVANVINMIVFYKQGLDSTINISFFSLAVSDLFSLVFQQFFNVFINPLFLDLGLPFVPVELQYLTTNWPRELFSRITCLITAFITAERCLCVVFPLQIKRIITPNRTVTIIIVIYVFTLLSPFPLYVTSYHGRKFYPELNRSLIGIIFSEYHYISQNIVYLMHSFFTMSGFLAVIIFTLILIFKLSQKSAWRQTAQADQEKAKSMSKRDRATITIVVLIASVLVICYTPGTIFALVTFIFPDISVAGKWSNMYQTGWSISFLCECINSSVNIFLYYKMSTKYRQTFRQLFSRCLKPDTNEVVEHDAGT